LKNARILGKENVKIQTLKFTYTTKTAAYPYAKNVGIKYQKKTLNGKKR